MSLEYTLMTQMKQTVFCVIQITFYILKYCKINRYPIETELTDILDFSIQER